MANDSQNHNVPSSPDAPKSGGKSKVGRILKNTLYGATAALTLMGSTSCSNGASGYIDPKQETTEVVINKPNYEGTDISDRTITDNIKGIVLCENPETKKLFLSDGNKKLTEDFDDIKKIGRFDGTLYFVGVNGGEHAIVNEEGDRLISGLDDIENYTIRKGDIAVSGKKDGQTYLFFNGDVIDEGRTYTIYINNDTDTKNGIYAQASNHVGNHRIISTFVNGEKVGPDFSYEYYEDGDHYGYCRVADYGDDEGFYIFSFGDSNNSPTTGTLIYNWETIGTNLKERGPINKNSDVLSYIKDGKQCILLPNGKEYSIVDVFPASEESSVEGESEESSVKVKHLDFYAENFYIIARDGDKFYLFDGELHELAGNYQYFIKSGKTPDGRFYFIGGNDGKETFELDGKKIGTLERITGVGSTKDGTIYLKGYNCDYSRINVVKSDVMVINGTVREDLNPDNDPQEWLHLGETRL